MRNSQKEKNKDIQLTNERKNTMKTTRRIITLALAAILALSLVVPALAATEGGTIEITGTSETVYSVYKMLTVEDGNDDKENVYKVEDAWIGFVTDTSMQSYFDVDTTDGNNYVLWLKDTASASDAAVIAELARAYVEDPANTAAAATKVCEIKVGNAETVSDNGYYLLVPNNNSVSGVIVVKNGETKTITEKTVAPGVPQLDKLVYEDSVQGYQKSNTVAVGETITYKVTITAGQGATKYVMHDIMDDHIDFDPNSVAITRGGHPVVNDPANYTVTFPTTACPERTDCCDFHIEFNETWCNSLNEGAVIVVTYTGTLLAETEGGSGMVETATDTDHENTSWLSYTDVAGIQTPDSPVATQTREVNVLKVDQDGDPLEGAGFLLKNNENLFYKYENGVVTWVAEDQNPTEYKSDENGKLRFYGVDAEIFQLVEKTVPGGYTGVGDTQANVKAQSIYDTDPVKVTNVLGKALPETGGMGTTLFYVLGGVLLIGALVVLATMKRKETSAQ